MKRIFRIFMLLFFFVAMAGFTACDKDDDKGKTEQNENGENQNGGGENNGGNGIVGNHEYVDLGLPSGTLWATCNVGANSPEEYGDYFAWGETVTKETYKTSNSKWYEVSYKELQAQGVIDTDGNLTVKYDVALNWGNDWRMPTLEEVRELSLALNSKFEVVNGVRGMIFTGTNGNSMFLPFAGYRSKDEFKYKSGSGYYWSATAYEYDGSAISFNVSSGEVEWGDSRRNLGRSVRLVLRTKNGGNQNGGTNGGNNGGRNGVVDNHEYVDLGLPSGTLWATCNIGATKSEEYGDYFAWGETEAKTKYTEDNTKWYCTSIDSLMEMGVIDKDSVLNAQYDAATVNWGKNWRMPTKEEIKELLFYEKGGAVVNGVQCRKFVGTNGNTLLLPLAGNSPENNKPQWAGAGGEGCYWSATTYGISKKVGRSYGLTVFTHTSAVVDGSYQNSKGCTVRPVIRTK